MINRIYLLVVLFIGTQGAYASFPIKRDLTFDAQNQVSFNLIPTVKKTLVDNSAIQKKEKAQGKKWILALVFSFFLGFIGIHRYYINHKDIGLVQTLLTVSVVGIPISYVWSLIDFTRILRKKLKPINAKYV